MATRVCTGLRRGAWLVHPCGVPQPLPPPCPRGLRLSVPVHTLFCAAGTAPHLRCCHPTAQAIPALIEKGWARVEGTCQRPRARLPLFNRRRMDLTCASAPPWCQSTPGSRRRGPPSGTGRSFPTSLSSQLPKAPTVYSSSSLSVSSAMPPNLSKQPLRVHHRVSALTG